MANGDKAAEAGMDVVDGFTADWRLGYDEINKTRDYIARLRRPHIEFTSTVSIPNAADLHMGTLTRVDAYSNDPDMAVQLVAGTINLAKAGIYAITLIAQIPAAATGTTLLGLQNAAGIPITRDSFTPGSSTLHLAHPNLVLPGPAQLRLYMYQTTGATRTVTGRVAITKLSEFP